MNYAEYKSLVDNGYSVGLDSSLAVSEVNGECAVNGFLALQLAAVSPQYSRGSEFEIYLGSGKGTTFLLTIARESFIFSAASALWSAAFLKEISYADAMALASSRIAQPYFLRHDYVIVHYLSVQSYKSKYRSGSSVWGAFLHLEDVQTSTPPYKNVGPIRAISDYLLPTSEHIDAAHRSASQSSSIDRYLSLYHLLELSFDFDLVEDIKGLQADLKGIGKLLSSYSHGELDRLIRLIRKYWTDDSEMQIALGKVFVSGPHLNHLGELLFDYEKKGNPYQDKQKFLAAASTAYTPAEFQRSKLGELKTEQLVKMVGYVIYRFRCAIAHATIGEHIISSVDESFVAEIAEPLIQSLLAHVYRKPT